MSYNQCKCLAINKNGFRLLMIFWRKQDEYTFLANIRSMFLIFVTPQKSRRMPTNAYELLQIFGDYVTMITNWWRMAFSAHSQAHSAWCKSTITIQTATFCEIPLIGYLAMTQFIEFSAIQGQ